jgi:hypothetical protein
MLAGGSFHMRVRGYAWLAGALSRAIESAVAQTPVASITWISRTERAAAGSGAGDPARLAGGAAQSSARRSFKSSNQTSPLTSSSDGVRAS